MAKRKNNKPSAPDSASGAPAMIPLTREQSMARAQARPSQVIDVPGWGPHEFVEPRLDRLADMHVAGANEQDRRLLAVISYLPIYSPADIEWFRTQCVGAKLAAMLSAIEKFATDSSSDLLGKQKSA